MKQPDLGKKITELRKAKGMTQEELVEKCNVSVRTIQRIEAGEVTPRSFTIKTILAALDYDLEKIRDEMDDQDEGIEQDWFSKALDGNGERSSRSVIRKLNIAWVAGIVYFILTFPEAIAEYLRVAEDEVLFGTPVYILLKVVLFTSFIFFQRGIILMATLFDNYLLKVTSMILIAATGLLFIYDIASVFYSNDGREFAIIPLAILFGAIGIVYGFSLKRLEKSLGRVAELAGIIEIIAGCLLLSVVLALLGDFIHIAAELLAIIMISKAVEIVKRRSAQRGGA